ncbi:dethiobiotin synthase [Filimonas effusa]|uniref:ATP-dependent dethiobiotin synthetase BioD n=1 Tax=Filimonas effusa TaxID=2508721 RepID=A0A4Q1DA02_9BACT|nr:dethiobiotin synthase [Filimonas effusa]RXK86212.1 dethiobiotin synthase [Filimonas effusa]
MKEALKLFVSGIGTGVGKTICAAILTEAFEADYWKPVQAGDLDRSDSMRVQALVSEDRIIHEERYRLSLPASPHKAARIENLQLQPSEWQLPATHRPLIVEGAGGLLVPLNDHYFMLDLISQWQLPVALVARDYLGCINHTLLSIALLSARHICMPLFIFNGCFDADAKRVISLQLSPGTKVLEIPDIENIDRAAIQQLVKTLHLF